MANVLIPFRSVVVGDCLLCESPKCLESEPISKLLVQFDEAQNEILLSELEKEELLTVHESKKKQTGAEVLASLYRRNIGSDRYCIGIPDKLKFLCSAFPEELEDFRAKFCPKSRPP